MQRKHACIAVLTLINGFNFMDRNTIAGVLSDIQKYFGINDQEGGLIQTLFYCFYMFSAPLFGYLGDRFDRKIVICCGLIIWNLAVLASTFIPGDLFWLFLLSRGFVGIGEGCSAIIAPTLIADYFGGKQRAQMLTVYYVASGVGAGLGFVVGSNVANAVHDWRWGVRVGPALGVIGFILFALIVYEPGRGNADLTEGDDESHHEVGINNNSTYWTDVRSILSNPTFVLSTVSNTMNLMVVGTMSWWAPTTILNARALALNLTSTDYLTSAQKDEVTLAFGAVTLVASLIGVSLALIVAERLKRCDSGVLALASKRAEPLVCSFGAVVATPCMLAAILCAKDALPASYVLVFIMICGLSFPWALNTNVTLTVVLPQRRSVAQAWQIMFGHLLGDAPGPWLVGVISDWVRGDDRSSKASYHSLSIALLFPNVVVAFSALFFFLTALTIVRDMRIVTDDLKRIAQEEKAMRTEFD